ncbi:MAG: heparan-alpha-glucosaminide N-acetyltransferase domain-containing protein [Saccharofermentanales bacterium]
MKKEINLQRAFEIDFLRGLAIIMMILHHFIYDIRYVMGIDLFAFQESFVFTEWIRAPFVFIFLFVSGISCSFSKNNFRRSAKMAGFALLFSGVFYVISIISGMEMYVIFNILHLLALGTLFYAILAFFEKKYDFNGVNAILIFTGVIFLWLSFPLSKLGVVDIPYLIPLFEGFDARFGMADYMPMVPWLGMFIFGALFGRLYYKDRQTLLPAIHAKTRYVTLPFEFVGRNSLLFYVLHQPVLIGVLYLLRFLGII